MRKELDAKLVTDYPELYRDRRGDPKETLMCWGFCCGDGWYHIIDALSHMLVAPRRDAERSLKFWQEHLGKEVWKGRIGTAADIAEAEKDLEVAHCPQVVQVKEKYGGLRFYVDRATEKQYNYIAFAEVMSYSICEKCGSPGRRYDIGWNMTLCDAHADEEYGEEAAHYRNKTGVWADGDSENK